jgi:hypothetical protein
MADERDWKHFAKMAKEAQKPALQQTDVSGRFVPIRYYITEFFCWVVCGIDFYKDYRRFYKGQNKGQNVP